METTKYFSALETQDQNSSYSNNTNNLYRDENGLRTDDSDYYSPLLLNQMNSIHDYLSM